MTQTTATSSANGKYQLSGTKHYVIDAQVAEVVFVAAREVDGSVALSAADTAADGLTVTPVQSMDTTRKLNTVTLANTPAPLIPPHWPPADTLVLGQRRLLVRPGTARW